ncbi:helix-turn-helix domain-containing protein [Geodermatophilaceae bacterium NBWT11]|nr:helix-turn-helix domain-containing protein [Geodermatophilaceae bacterium NBWT11]
MPRTPKPTWAPLPEFAGTSTTGPARDRALQDRLEAYVVKAYRQGMSIREIAQLVDRAPTTVHGVLKAHQVPRSIQGRPPAQP